jgi:hypothetical protein
MCFMKYTLLIIPHCDFAPILLFENIFCLLFVPFYVIFSSSGKGAQKADPKLKIYVCFIFGFSNSSREGEILRTER